MKKILFISRSQLSHNLLQSVLSLLPFKVALDCREDLNELPAISDKAKPFHLILADWNALVPLEQADPKMVALTARKPFQESQRVLIYPHTLECPRALLTEKGFHAFYPKPLLSEELAEIIIKALHT